jgi:chromate reductase
MSEAGSDSSSGLERFEILGLAGSLRRASINRGLLRAAREVSPEDVAFESFDLSRMPFFDADVEAKRDPGSVAELKERIRAADAVLIASPEYDYALPGVLVTALDWAMRPPSPMKHKPVGIIGASPSGAGTARGQMVLRQMLLHAPAYVMPEPQMLVANARQRFDGEGNLADEETRQRLERFVLALREWAHRMQSPVIS